MASSGSVEFQVFEKTAPEEFVIFRKIFTPGVCGFGGIYLHFGTDFGRTARGGVDLDDVLADVHDVHVLV